MLNDGLHLSDQEMLLAADGELSKRRAARVRVHLSACWQCRARMTEIEAAATDFARTHLQALDSQLPTIAGPRALLRAQLAEMASASGKNSQPWRFHFGAAAPFAALLCVSVFAAVLLGGLLSPRSSARRKSSTLASFEKGAVPDRILTPGATRRVTVSDVCSMAHEEVVAEVSTSLRQKVFQEYGMVNARASDYEIDYLIAPGLGGVEDIHNLWPEPYTSRTWNAYVKDALEEHLHQMVCGGQLDLSTAQSDIATDWIAAYKKYFHTDRPLSLHSRLDPAPLSESAGTGLRDQ